MFLFPEIRIFFQSFRWWRKFFLGVVYDTKIIFNHNIRLMDIFIIAELEPLHHFPFAINEKYPITMDTLLWIRHKRSIVFIPYTFDQPWLNLWVFQWSHSDCRKWWTRVWQYWIHWIPKQFDMSVTYKL